MSNFYELEALNQAYSAGVVYLNIQQLRLLELLNRRVEKDKIFTSEDGEIVKELLKEGRNEGEMEVKYRSAYLQLLGLNSHISHETRKKFVVIAQVECHMGINTTEISRDTYETREEAMQKVQEINSWRRHHAYYKEEVMSENTA